MLDSLNRIMAILLLFGTLNATCTKKGSQRSTTPPVSNSYVPETWDLKSDWPSSTLKPKDIDP